MASSKIITLLVCFLSFFVGLSCTLPTAEANPIDWPIFRWFPGIFGIPKHDPVIVKVEPAVALRSDEGNFLSHRRSKLKVKMADYESGVLGGTLYFAEASYVRLATITGGPGEAVDTQCGFIISPDGNAVSQLFTPGEALREIEQAWGVICTSYL